MKNLFNRFVREEAGQDLIEYALLAALIAVACIAAMQTLASDISDIFRPWSALLGESRSTAGEGCCVTVAIAAHLRR